MPYKDILTLPSISLVIMM